MVESYKYGFTTDTETDQLPPGLDEKIITQIQGVKSENFTPIQGQ